MSSVAARPAIGRDLVWELLQPALAGGPDAGPPGALDVLDVGGGTGGFAVRLAALGHRVTLVDPSPDALASLQRRARDEGVVVQALQGDAAGLLDVVGPASADLVLCHGVLDRVDDPDPAVAALAAVLRPGGALSAVVANRTAAVLARAVAGHLADARRLLADPDGRWGPGDPLPRRFSAAGLRALLATAGLAVEAVHGVRAVVDLVPAAAIEHDPAAAEELVALERAAADLPELQAVATQLHVLARRS